jgi:hypothetical protein
MNDRDDSIEITSIEGGEDAGPAPQAGGADETAPWMCHRCSATFAAAEGAACSRCYRSTCRDCLDAASTDEAPVCVECAGDDDGT